MTSELSEKELKIIIEWYHIADAYFSERGVYMEKEDEILVVKLKEKLKKQSN